jgi:hypothetical protein
MENDIFSFTALLKKKKKNQGFTGNLLLQSCFYYHIKHVFMIFSYYVICIFVVKQVGLLFKLSRINLKGLIRNIK